jgi:hypothetical protein
VSNSFRSERFPVHRQLSSTALGNPAVNRRSWAVNVVRECRKQAERRTDFDHEGEQGDGHDADVERVDETERESR